MKQYRRLSAFVLLGVITAFLVGCSKEEGVSQTPTPEPEPRRSFIEIPDASGIKPTDIDLIADGTSISVGSDNGFNTAANSYVVFGKNDSLLYLCYASIDDGKNTEPVKINAEETAIALLLPVLPNAFVETPDADFIKLKNLIGNVPETQFLAKAIEKSVIDKGYTDFAEIKEEFLSAKNRILELSGLKDIYDKMESVRARRAVSQFKEPKLGSSKYRGIRLDLTERKWDDKNKTWNCVFKAYSWRFTYHAFVHAIYDKKQNMIYPYDNSIWNESRYLIEPVNVSHFMKKSTSLSGAKASLTDMWKLISEKDFTIDDFTWDATKLSDIKISLKDEDDVILVITSQEREWLKIFNTVMVVADPVLSLIGKSDKIKKKIVFDFSYKFATDPMKLNEVRNIIADSTISGKKRVVKVLGFVSGEFWKYLKKKGYKEIKDVAIAMSGKEIDKILGKYMFYVDAVKLGGDAILPLAATYLYPDERMYFYINYVDSGIEGSIDDVPGSEL
ncbi:hypothetical protein [Prevotella sp. HUN102]|uniref:hypothetical protein n=1 Tax=Prevotella sp. HUN102 TaxID=1392486 RepID=UPI000A52CB91|nr:hypothetical protein [Prevotella sp. HUN102]